jgi:hypothetical protein
MVKMCLTPLSLLSLTRPERPPTRVAKPPSRCARAGAPWRARAAGGPIAPTRPRRRSGRRGAFAFVRKSELGLAFPARSADKIRVSLALSFPWIGNDLRLGRLGE